MIMPYMVNTYCLPSSLMVVDNKLKIFKNAPSSGVLVLVVARVTSLLVTLVLSTIRTKQSLDRCMYTLLIFTHVTRLAYFVVKYIAIVMCHTQACTIQAYVITEILWGVLAGMCLCYSLGLAKLSECSDR